VLGMLRGVHTICPMPHRVTLRYFVNLNAQSANCLVNVGVGSGIAVGTVRVVLEGFNCNCEFPHVDEQVRGTISFWIVMPC